MRKAVGQESWKTYLVYVDLLGRKTRVLCPLSRNTSLRPNEQLVLAVSTGDYCLSSVLAHTGSQTHIVNKHSNYMNARSRGGSVGIVTRYGLEGPVTKSRWG